jgi:peptide deformylase
LAILKIAQLGHPVLRRVGDPVTREEVASERIQRLIDDMIETMREHSGVGIAAPQVHLSRQIAVIESSERARYPVRAEFPMTVVVNPVIVERSNELIYDWEGCLSIEGLRGRVPRNARIVVEALDRNGKPQRLELDEFPAIVAQHEIDHLQGVLFIDRMEDLRTLAFNREYSRYWVGDDEDDDEDDAVDEADGPGAAEGR